MCTGHQHALLQRGAPLEQSMPVSNAQARALGMHAGLRALLWECYGCMPAERVLSAHSGMHAIGLPSLV